MEPDMRTRLAMVAAFLFVLESNALLAARPTFAQAWPPPPQTVPSIGLKTPDPTTAFPSSVPSIGLKAPDPTTAFPGPVPSIGLQTPDPTTAPSIGTSP